MKDRLSLFTAGVVGLSFLLLLVAFHSPLISLKAAAIMVVVFLAFLAAPDVFLKALRHRPRVGDLPRRDRRARPAEGHA